MNNDAETFDGGAIYLLSFSQIILSPGAQLYFISNTGRYICIMIDYAVCIRTMYTVFPSMAQLDTMSHLPFEGTCVPSTSELHVLALLVSVEVVSIATLP